MEARGNLTLVRRVTTAGSAILILVLTMTLTTPAHAAETDTAERGGLDGDLVAAYAHLNGVPEVVAIERIWQEDAINDALGRVAEEYGEQDHDVWLDDSSGELVLNIRTDDPVLLEALSESAQSAGLSMSVDRSKAKVAARTDAASQVAENLVAAIPNLAGFYVDPLDGALVLDVASAAAADARGSTSLATSITGMQTRANLVGPAGDHATVNGGVTSSSCTVGFTAVYNTGSTIYSGFMTAAHCRRPFRYYYNTAGTGTLKTATYWTQNYGSNADIAFYSVASGDTISSRFYGSSATSTTTQGANTTVSTGTTVCRRGAATGYDCGKVSSTTYKPTWNEACPGSPCNAVFVRTPQKTKGGDSGGPVWTGSARPVGIHKGGSAGVLGIGQFSVYSKIGYRPAGVNLR